MPTTKTRTTQQIAADRNKAETALAKAENAANTLRVEHAGVVLREAFPHHSLAVFGRAWDEDAPRLMQLLSSEEGVGDIDFEDDAAENLLPREQMVACATAERAVRLIGDDDEVSRYLNSGAEAHEDWYEFNLTLNG